jgi:hypothetical protein
MQQEWEEGLEQLQLIFVVVLMPWLGKFWGRKWAHSRMSSTSTLSTRTPIESNNRIVHARYLKLGLGKAFFYL